MGGVNQICLKSTILNEKRVSAKIPRYSRFQSSFSDIPDSASIFIVNWPSGFHLILMLFLLSSLDVTCATSWGCSVEVCRKDQCRYRSVEDFNIGTIPYNIKMMAPANEMTISKFHN